MTCRGTAKEIWRRADSYFLLYTLYIMHNILIADDDHSLRVALGRALRDNNYACAEAASGHEAVEYCEQKCPDAVLLDMVMPGMDGLEALKRLKSICRALPVIMITGHGDIPAAVDAMKLGAYDFIVKPAKIENILNVIRRAMEKNILERELHRLSAAAATSLEWMLGRSEMAREMISQIQQVAKTDFSVILEGETGVGKSFIAGIIHSISRRANGPFVRVDMSAIPETLADSELFGFEKGSFTGAVSSRKGRLEAATGGTLFIDEIENLSSYVQAKFLSVLEERRIQSIGGGHVDIDIRVISAVNMEIKKLLAEGSLRKDFFYRMSEFVIVVPPLRDRAEDIPFLARKFLNEACADLRRPLRTLAEETIELLVRYPWPGNIRELRNVIRRTALMFDCAEVLPRQIEFFSDNSSATQGGKSFLLPLKEVSATVVRDAEKKAVQTALAATKGNKTRAASILQIDFKTLQTKIREYNIQ
jgi:DNA-binding NtrC family response regulator